MLEELHGAKIVGAGQSGSPLAGSTHPKVGMRQVLSLEGCLEQTGLRGSGELGQKLRCWGRGDSPAWARKNVNENKLQPQGADGAGSKA